MIEKIVLITGATTGIGKETAVGLAQSGMTVVFTSRDAERGTATQMEIVNRTNNPRVMVLACDLASFESIRKCCQEYHARYQHLDVLINNAGVWDYRRRLSKDGIENTFATNYLAPFLMTNLLLAFLKKSSRSRIINVTSGFHSGPIRFDDLEFKKSFSGRKAYSQSKLALILFTKLLAKTLAGSGVTVNVLQPGMVATNLARDAGSVSRTIFKLIAQSPQKGAESLIYLASSPEVSEVTGEYFVKKKIATPSAAATDLETAQKLWDVSVAYVGL